MALNACEIDQLLRNAADDVVGIKRNLSGTRSMVSAMVTSLDGMATKYDAMIAAVNDAGYGSTADQAANKAKLTAIVGAYTALRADAVSLRDWTTTNIAGF
jgi:hypothetical protein